jgi:hypothetical protein
MRQTAVAIALVSATTLGFANSSHAMSLPSQSVLKQAVPSDTTEVYWRGGRGWGPGIGFGIAAGALTAAALANRPYWGGGYGGGYPGYAYAPAYDYGSDYAPAYDYGYGYAPAYSDAYEPAYAYGPAYSYSYGPAYSYSNGTTYVRPRARYAYGRIGPRVRYANTWGSGVRSTYSSGPRYSAVGSRSTVRVVNRRR